MSTAPQNTENSPSKGAVTIRTIALLLLILLPLAALGSRFGLWPFTVGLPLVLVSIGGCVVVQIVNAIWLLRKPQLGTKSALRWACLFALPPLVVAASLMRSSDDAQAGIHNISTDTINPPQFVVGVEKRGTTSNPLEYTEQVAEIQRTAFPAVAPIESNLTKDDAFNTALKAAEQLGWDVYAQDADKGHIEAVDTTFWFGFKDDVVIRITSTDKGSRIDLRSVSRVGVSDLGANAKRILAFTDAFNAK